MHANNTHLHIHTHANTNTHASAILHKPRRTVQIAASAKMRTLCVGAMTKQQTVTIKTSQIAKHCKMQLHQASANDTLCFWNNHFSSLVFWKSVAICGLALPSIFLIWDTDTFLKSSSNKMNICTINKLLYKFLLLLYICLCEQRMM